MTETATGETAGAGPAIDEELLQEAQRDLGMAASRNEAINAALRGFVDQQRARRRAALQDLRRMSAGGVFSHAVLDDIDK